MLVVGASARLARCRMQIFILAVFFDFPIYIWPSGIAIIWGCCSGKARQWTQEDPGQHPSLGSYLKIRISPH